MLTPNSHVGIIGSGLGGLSAACTLAARGYEVTVFEKNNWLGGKAAVLEQDGFRFDMGPTILTVPSVLARIFSEAERSVSSYLDLVPLDPQWRSFYSGRLHPRSRLGYATDDTRPRRICPWHRRGVCPLSLAV